jgi:hypothetical protein
MSRIVVRLAAAAALAFVGTAARSQDATLVVHEWGTFTTVAGQDGNAVPWLPLGGPIDLPCFVNRFQNQLFKYVGANAPLTYDRARTALQGTVRMETPVLYFYAAHATTVDVSVRFPQGLMTEWYPKAAVTQPVAYADGLSRGAQSTITWNGVRVRPGAVPSLPREANPSHYYAARQTDAAPVQVLGQDEKFLFYRGVGGFQVPLSTVVTADEGVLVTNTSGAAPLHVVLFENRGGHIGYRVHDNVMNRVALDRPRPTANVASLGRLLERMLVSAGLYEREAHAMVETWRDSWFEEGTRLFYLVPGATIDAVLPLAITPPPARVARAFVGRMEIITPTTIRAVRDAIAEADDGTLIQYGRFLGPIADRIVAAGTEAERAQTQAVIGAKYQSYLAGAALSCK